MEERLFLAGHLEEFILNEAHIHQFVRAGKLRLMCVPVELEDHMPHDHSVAVWLQHIEKGAISIEVVDESDAVELDALAVHHLCATSSSLKDPCYVGVFTEVASSDSQISQRETRRSEFTHSAQCV